MKPLVYKPMIAAIAAALAVFAAPLALDIVDSPDGAAYAQSGSGKGQMGAGDRGQGGAKAPGGRGGEVAPSAEEEPDEDKKGPKYGGGSAAPEPGERGGKPAWAGGAVPEDVELGRMNVARAPEHVLARSLAEALLALQADATLYNLASLQAVIDAIYAGTVFRVDSPLQNLALYKDLVVDGQIGDGSVPVSSDTLMLLSIFLGGASDKTVPITEGTVSAINTIMEITLPSTVTVADLAVAAEAVRVAIFNAHEGIPQPQ